MRTNVDNVFAAGDVTRFHDVLLDERARNGSWGSAKAQGTTAAHNMVEYGTETFEWVSSYSITHFVPVPLVRPSGPSATTRRRQPPATASGAASRCKDGKVVGGVLIGDLSPQTAFKQLMREGRDVSGQTDRLMEPGFSVEDLAPTTRQ